MSDENVDMTQAVTCDSVAPTVRQGYGLTLCLVWNRMLIHRKTIRALGDPQRMRLLINPDSRHFCVQGCDKKEACSFTVPREMAPVYDPFYIHSKFLLGQIYSMMAWNPSLSYRVFGKINTSTQVMDFDLSRYVQVHGDEHLENDEVPEEFLQEFGNPAPRPVPETEPLPEPSESPTLSRGPTPIIPSSVPKPTPGRFVSSLFDSVRLPRKQEE